MPTSHLRGMLVPSTQPPPTRKRPPPAIATRLDRVHHVVALADGWTATLGTRASAGAILLVAPDGSLANDFPVALQPPRHRLVRRRDGAGVLICDPTSLLEVLVRPEPGIRRLAPRPGGAEGHLDLVALAGDRLVCVGSDRLWLLARVGGGAEEVEELPLAPGRYEAAVAEDGETFVCADGAPGRGPRRVIVWRLVDGRLALRGFTAGPGRAPFAAGDGLFVIQAGVVHRIELPQSPPRLDAPLASERARAAAALEPHEPRAVPVLVGLLGDPDPWVRRAAVGALYRLDAVQAAPALVASFADPDGEVVRAASNAVCLWGSRARAALTEALSDGRPLVRRRALPLALALEPAPPADALASLLDDEATRELAATALGAQGDPRAVPELLRLAETSPRAQAVVDLLVAVLERRGAEVSDAALASAMALRGTAQFDEVEEDDDRGARRPRPPTPPPPPHDPPPPPPAPPAGRRRRARTGPDRRDNQPPPSSRTPR
jgi:hypothetical protein